MKDREGEEGEKEKEQGKRVGKGRRAREKKEGK